MNRTTLVLTTILIVAVAGVAFQGKKTGIEIIRDFGITNVEPFMKNVADWFVKPQNVAVEEKDRSENGD
jgi:hypothetical protein